MLHGNFEPEGKRNSTGTCLALQISRSREVPPVFLGLEPCFYNSTRLIFARSPLYRLVHNSSRLLSRFPLHPDIRPISFVCFSIFATLSENEQSRHPDRSAQLHVIRLPSFVLHHAQRWRILSPPSTRRVLTVLPVPCRLPRIGGVDLPAFVSPRMQECVPQRVAHAWGCQRAAVMGVWSPGLQTIDCCFLRGLTVCD